MEGQLRQQFEAEIEDGMMMKMALASAREKYGDSLRIAPLGAIPKLDDTLRTLHDGTHGAGVNPNLRVRDQLRCSGSSDIKHAIGDLESRPGRSWGLTADVSRAHRKYNHRE